MQPSCTPPSSTSTVLRAAAPCCSRSHTSSFNPRTTAQQHSCKVLLQPRAASTFLSLRGTKPKHRHSHRSDRRLAWPCSARSGSGEGSSQTRGEYRGGLDPSLEVAVPPEQRPVNELAQLRKANLYSWATLDTRQYLTRLGLVWLGFFTVIGAPIAYQTFDPLQQPAEFLLSGGTGALVVVAVAVLRLYLGWAYVGDRLLSAAVEYEETGWYDGQLFVKPPEVLARDRLLGSYEVKPVLQRLKATLTGSGAALMLSTALLFGFIHNGTDADGVYGRGAARAPREVTAEGIIYSSQVRSLADLKDDDEAAAAEALAQDGSWDEDVYWMKAHGYPAQTDPEESEIGGSE